MTNHDLPPTPPSIDSMAAAAQLEDWDSVDAALLTLPDDQAVNDRAASWLDNEDGNMRDLGASVFERSKLPLSESVIVRLSEMLTDDTNPYASYRSAFALFCHDIHTPKVVDALQLALQDEDVAEIAAGYLLSRVDE